MSRGSSPPTQTSSYHSEEIVAVLRTQGTAQTIIDAVQNLLELAQARQFTLTRTVTCQRRSTGAVGFKIRYSLERNGGTVHSVSFWEREVKHLPPKILRVLKALRLKLQPEIEGDAEPGRVSQPCASFGKVLLEVRHARGLTQRQVAAQAGMEASQLSRIETNSTGRPEATTIERLAAALDCTEAERIALFHAAGRFYPPLAEWLRKVQAEPEIALRLLTFNLADLRDLTNFTQQLHFTSAW